MLVIPKPLQSPPPVLVGAVGTDSTLLDIVRHADGWMPIEGTEHIRQRWQRLHQLAIDHNREPAELSLVIYGSSGDPRTIDTHHDAAAHEIVISVAGDQDEVLRQLDAHSALTTRFA